MSDFGGQGQCNESPSTRVDIAHIVIPLATPIPIYSRCKISDKGVEALHKI